MKTLSKYSDCHVFIIRPKNGGIVTLKDQRQLVGWPTWKRAAFCSLHFATSHRSETVARIKAANVSKTMVVTEITDAQWARRFEQPETIKGTGIRATSKQLEASFEIGVKN